METNLFRIGTITLCITLMIACGPASEGTRPSGAPAGEDRRTMDDSGTRVEPTSGADMAERGRMLVESECQRCHGSAAPEEEGARDFHNITAQRDREWLMDFMMARPVDTPDEGGRQLLEACEVRQPGHALDQQEARQVVEYLGTL